MTASPLILPFDGILPQFRSPPVHVGFGAAVLGKAELGQRAALGAFSVVRADGHFVRAGDDLYLGPSSTIHIAHEIYPCVVGNRLAVGSNACVHACTVGDDVVVGNGCAILDGSSTGDNVVFADNSTVFPGKDFPGGYLYAGSPAEPVRPLAAGEAALWRARMIEDHSKTLFDMPSAMLEGSSINPTVFIAQTAIVIGAVKFDAFASVFFSTIMDAGKATISVGRQTNVQDNTLIRCRGPGVVIGAETTVGHNVTIHDSFIGNRCLIGIGSTVSAGTVIEDHVLLAANAITERDQVLTSGHLWAGTPARPIARLTPSKLALIATIIPHYVAYAEAYKGSQERNRGQ